MLVVLVSGNSLAQTQANANLPASATVLTALTIHKNTDVKFGNVGATTLGIVYLDPTGAASNYIGTGAQVGVITIAGATGQDIRITWPSYIDLSHGLNHLNYVLQVNGYTANTPTSSTPLTSGGSTATTDATSGNYFLFIGGQLGGSTTTAAALSSQATDTYSGSAPFTVEYN